MKLILAIVNNDDAGDVADVLTKENFQITKIATTGGFLKIGNTTLILGVEDQDLDKAINLIGGCARRRTAIVPVTASYDTSRLTSCPMEVQVGGATIFVLDVEQFIKL